MTAGIETEGCAVQYLCVKVLKCVCMLPGCKGRVCRGRGLSRGSLPVRNTGEMGAGPVASD